MSYFPFDDYIYSTSEEDYKKDLNMRNSIVKYVNAIMLELDGNSDASVPLVKFKNTCMIFKNTFSKEAFLYYYLNRFDDDERSILNFIIFDMFVRSENGYIGDHKKFYELSFELFTEVNMDSPLKETWNYILDYGRH